MWVFSIVLSVYVMHIFDASGRKALDIIRANVTKKYKEISVL